MKANWPTKKLGEVCELKTGGTPNRNHPEYFGGDIKWLVSGDIHQLEICDCEGRLTEEGLKNSNARLLPTDSVMIALNGQGKTRGTVALLRVQATCNQSLVAMIPDRQKLLPEFLYWNLHGRYLEIRSLTGMDKRQGLNMRIILNIEIPLPPLSEQKKIVKVLEEKLGKVKEAIKLREDALADTEKILPARLTEIFEEGKKKGWAEKELGKFVKLQGGYAFKSANYENGNGVPLVRIQNLKNERVNLTKAVHLPYQIFEDSSNFHLESRDILIAMSGATTGKLARIKEEQLPALLNQRVGRFKIDNSASKDFIYYFLKHKQSHILEIAYGGAQPNISGNKIEALKICLPDLKTQEKIVKELDAVSARVAELRALQEAQLQDLKSLERAYLHEAFEGKLV